jgi:hypothetical protein
MAIREDTTAEHIPRKKTERRGAGNMTAKH